MIDLKGGEAMEDMDPEIAKGLSRSRRRGELIGWFYGKREAKLLIKEASHPIGQAQEVRDECS